MIEMILSGLMFLIALVVVLAFVGCGVFLILDAAYFSRPLWRTYYPPDGRVDFGGGYSQRFSYWHARDYASIFNGKVVKHTDVYGRPADYIPESR